MRARFGVAFSSLGMLTTVWLGGCRVVALFGVRFPWCLEGWALLSGRRRVVPLGGPVEVGSPLGSLFEVVYHLFQVLCCSYL